MKSIREDYICGEDKEDELLLFNPDWKISPSIAFVEGKGPVILTCYDHNGGTKKLMIHTCKWKHNLASKHPDQLCQAVIQPRLLKPVSDSLIRSGENDVKSWAQCGAEVISLMDEESFGIVSSELSLICVFNE